MCIIVHLWNSSMSYNWIYWKEERVRQKERERRAWNVMNSSKVYAQIQNEKKLRSKNGQIQCSKSMREIVFILVLLTEFHSNEIRKHWDFFGIS